MPLLDAALAFALTMLAVATVVTQIVNFLKWILENAHALIKQWIGARTKMFDDMIKEFLDREFMRLVTIAPQFDNDLTRAELKQLKDTITEKGLAHISSRQLIDLIQHTELGRQAVQTAGKTIDFQAFSNRFEDVEKKYTEMFRTKARIIATVVALILALAFNIDSVNILESYLSNPKLAAEFAAKSDAAMASYKAGLERVPVSPEKKATPASETATPSAENATAEAEETNDALLKQFEKSSEDLRKEFNQLNSSGFPFGWSYFPYGQVPPKSIFNQANPTAGGRTAKADYRRDWKVWFAWGIGIAFTSLLAGLGAPFWYDVIQNLVSLTRSSSSNANRQDPPPVMVISQGGEQTVSPGTTQLVGATRPATSMGVSPEMPTKPTPSPATLAPAPLSPPPSPPPSPSSM